MSSSLFPRAGTLLASISILNKPICLDRSSRMLKRFSPLLILSLVIPCVMMACDRSPVIKTQKVPKEEMIVSGNQAAPDALPAAHPDITPPFMSGKPAASTPDSAGPFTMIGAIIPVGEMAWFYKLSGPADQVAPLEESILNFLKATKYVDGKPDLSSVPDAWTTGPGNSMRFATLRIPHDDKSFDLAISTLSLNGSWDEYSLININRWRQQLGLPEVKLSELITDNESEVVEEIETPAGKGRYVRLTGPKNPNASGMSAPFMGR